MRILGSVILLAAVSVAWPRSKIDPEIETGTKQYVKQQTLLGQNLPNNATHLDVCFKSNSSLDNCDVYNTRAVFSLHASPPYNQGVIRIFWDEIGYTMQNIFEAQLIVLTLRNKTGHSVTEISLSHDWITLRKMKNWIIVAMMNQSHPNINDVLGAMERYELTNDDSHIRDLLIIGVRMEVFCRSNWYGEDCGEFCPAGCAHGTCDNGICSACEFPYHGESCDQCGTGGDCINGVCKLIEEGNITSGVCTCEPLYEGAQCESLINDCTIVPCSPQGRCNVETKKCKCLDSRFSGNFCEIYSYWGSKQVYADGFCVFIILFLFTGIVIRIKFYVAGWTFCIEEMDECEEKFIDSETPQKDFHKELLDSQMLDDIANGRETHL